MLFLLILRWSQPRWCFIYQLFGTLSTYLPSSNISFRMQPARFVWVSSPESIICQYVLSICFESRPLVQGAHHLGSNVPETEPFSVCPSWLLNGISSISAAEPGPSALCNISLKRRPNAFIGSELSLLGLFLDYMHTGSY